ncbi:MAG: hypothetical protein ABSD59_11275 [Terracidiphilus sp.]|jgi:hypothetical protein
MKQTATTRRKFIAGGAVLVLTLPIVATPTGRSLAVSALLDFVEITQEAARLPCCIADHSRCSSLDRLDPACPQCM